jgi:hypothetical protein
MAIATGASTQFSYITEVTAGTTPATPEFSIFAVNDFSLLLSKDTFTDPSIQNDRQVHFLKHGNKKVGGNVAVTLLPVGADPADNLLFDPWLESLFNSSWTSNVLKIGNTPKSFTFEKIVTDVAGTDTYFRYKGVQATALTVDVALNAPVKATFTFAGLDQDALTTSAISGATYLDQPDGPQPLVHINASNFFKEGGASTSLMTALSFTIDNSSDTNYALGSAVANSITSSTAKVTGSATYYFSDTTLYNKFVNETATSLEVKLSDGSDSYTIKFPRVVYSAANSVVNNDKTVIVTMPFTAVFDPVSATSVQITRA